MACDFERFRQAAKDLHPDEKLCASLCAIEHQISDFEGKVGKSRGDRAAYEYVIGDITLHPFWFHAWQRVRRAAEAA
jgi:hypothetical protein